MRNNTNTLAFENWASQHNGTNTHVTQTYDRTPVVMPTESQVPFVVAVCVASVAAFAAICTALPLLA